MSTPERTPGPFRTMNGWGEDRSEHDLARSAGCLPKSSESDSVSNGARVGTDSQDYPVSSLPTFARSFVDEVTRSVGSVRSAVATSLLVAAAAAVGNSRVLRVKESYEEISTLWGLMVAPSGFVKSPVFQLITEPINQIAEELLAHPAPNEARDGWAGGRRGPTPRRIVVSDATMEALVELMVNNPRGLLLQRDELSGLLKSFDAYRGGRGADVENWLSIHSGKRIIVDRVKFQGVGRNVPRPSVSILGTTQPVTLAACLRGLIENGFLARWLLVGARPRVRKWTDAGVSRASTQRYTEILRRLLGVASAATPSDATSPKSIVFSPDAQVAWANFFDNTQLEIQEVSPELGAAFEKLCAMAARIALVLHMLSWAESEDCEPGEILSAETLRKAISIVKFHKVETRRLYAELLSDAGATQAQRDSEWIQKRRGGRVDLRDFQNARHIATKPEAERRLQALVERGWARMEPAVGNRSPVAQLCGEAIAATSATDRSNCRTVAASPRSPGSGEHDRGGVRWKEEPTSRGPTERDQKPASPTETDNDADSRADGENGA